MQKDIQGKIWADQTAKKIADYWTYRNFARRAEWLAVKLQQYEFKSIFEVGFFSGRNLKIIKDFFPKVKIGGIDINEKAVIFAKDKLPQADLKVCSIYDMDVADKWDIVFTMGVMIHIPPDGIETAVDNCFAKANKYIIHAETMDNDKIINGPIEMNPTKKVKEKFQWWPNLSDRYKKRGGNIIVNEQIPYFRKDHPFRLIIVEK